MTEPQRRELRRTHLDASVVPVERALLARAEALQAEAEALASGDTDLLGGVKAMFAAEFRELAEELHYW